MFHENALLFLIILPFLGAILAAMQHENARNTEAWLSAGITLSAFVIAIMLYPYVEDGGVIRREIEWMPELGMNFSLRMDGFAWMFTMLISGIGLLVVIYARYYMSPQDPVPRFYAFLLCFMGAMQGVVISGNLILISVFWELTSIFSFLLIGYWHHNAAAREGARMALIITGAGGLLLLFGMVLIGYIVGSYDLDVVLASGNTIRSSNMYVPALLFVLAGALTKSAQFPFHFWLPNAMAAPTPVSAYLHSATMVKAGVFLLARFWPVLAGTDQWFYIVGFAGMASLAVGAYFAIFHMMNHATFKASLFMAAGIIDHESGTRDMRKLSGLFSALPITATLAMVASAAMAGVPLLNGFLSKEMFFAETIVEHRDSWFDTATPYIATLASAFAVTYSIRFIHAVFFGPKAEDLPREPHEPPHWMRLPIELLVLACLLVGVIPGFTIGPYLHTAVVSVLGARTPEYSLAVWHGFNLPLIMSTLAFVAGILLYLALRYYLATSPEDPPGLRWLKGQRIFDRVLVTVSWRWARWIEANFGTRRLQPQLRILVGTALVVGAWPLFDSGFLS